MNGKFTYQDMSKGAAINTFRKKYSVSYATNQNAVFKAFTTDHAQVTGWVPHYELAVTGRQLGITSTELNPFGANTAGDGNVHGANLNGFDDPLTCYDDRWVTRSVGIKTPMTHIGYGYDIFGYPSPNYSVAWDMGGALSTGTPESLYAPFELEGESSAVGSDSDPSTWKAGPLDLRWDQHRKVWTCNYGVYAAVVHKAYSGTTAVTDFNIPLWGEHIRYDARIYDGLNSGILVTGITNSIFRPAYNTYKVYPTATGQPCLISHVPGTHGPRFGILSWEKPATTGCSSSSYSLGTEYLSYTSLDSSPLETTRGGTAIGTAPDYGDILVGSDDGTYQQLNLQDQGYLTITRDLSNIYFDVRRTYLEVTGTYAVQPIDITLFTNITSTGHIIYLPDATGRTGSEIVIKDAGGQAGTYNFRVLPLNTGQFVEGTTGYLFNTNRQSAWFMNDGSNWHIL